MKSLKMLLVMLLSLTWLTGARAADVPANLIVNAGGLQWAYVDPCSPFEPNSCNSSGQSLVMHDGWNIATASNFLASFTGLRDLYNQFDGGRKCASAYFNSGWSHCDGSNILDGHVWNMPSAWGPNANQWSWDETFVVRGAAVPEPGSLALLGLGLIGLIAGRRRAAAQA